MVTRLEELLLTAGTYVVLSETRLGDLFVTPDLPDKVRLCDQYGVKIGAGGTLMEIAALRDRRAEMITWLLDAGMNVLEISDGLGRLGPRKRDLIRSVKDESLVIVAEIGFKAPDRSMETAQWIAEAEADLEAGADYVLIEGRESGTVGAFNPDGSVRTELVESLAAALPAERLVFEAPRPSSASLVRSVLRAQRESRQRPTRRGDLTRNAALGPAGRHG